MYDVSLRGGMGEPPHSSGGSMNQGPPRTAFVIYSASPLYYVAPHSRDASRAADCDAHVSVKESR
jgi:hypothetical protein